MSWHGALGTPDDAPRVAALVLGLTAPWWARRLLAVRHHRLSWALAAAAALLSLGYVAHYLRGGPRIIDATSYYLEARTLAAGKLTLPLFEPEPAVLGRFLVRAPGSPPAASVIFPPGYPAVLALGFAVGAPMLIGPLLAAALVLATGWLARRCASPNASGAPVRFAMLVSAACAALRYHTADTMAHGLAALCLCLAAAAVLEAARRAERGAPQARALLVAGLAGGWLLATRPATCLTLAAMLAALAAHPPVRALLRPRPALAFLLGTLPGIGLWLAYQHAATGSWSATAQGAYYALSDGPAGCFRYGFGARIGCLGEHGDFVRHNLADGYGALAALGTTGRRLKMHVEDAFNIALLFPLVLLGAWRGRRDPAVRALSIGVVAQVAAYAPFYFDGNYPGGGARMLADVLPLEHVLGGLGVLALAEARPRLPPARLAALAAGLSLVGFALRTAPAHAALRDREGGLPMFEPHRVKDRDALLLLDTDHGFNLAFDPARPGRVARYRGDALDRLAWEHAGRPAAVRYRYRWQGGDAATVWLEPVVFDPRPLADLELTIEGESLWPPMAQHGGWAWPSHFAAGCVSGGRALNLEPEADPARAVLALPPSLGGRHLSARLWRAAGASGALRVLIDGREVAQRPLPSASGAGCVTVSLGTLPAGAGSAPRLVLESSGPVALDALFFGKFR